MTDMVKRGTIAHLMDKVSKSGKRTYLSIKLSNNDWHNVFDSKIVLAKGGTYDFQLEPSVYNGQTYFNVIGALEVGDAGPVQAAAASPVPSSSATSTRVFTRAELCSILVLIHGILSQGGNPDDQFNVEV